ncbi:MAG: L-seryl-tRNA(Sec) selenium transferase [Acidobacteriaceae bacterium]|nr:L-seryl-tRNA(Sec) selenium transferase [Acidobacteriaceae bacterium]MBV9297162.1 L-seryl-tRNA(Sec) selenium transferase [Acidobacteriaceae bacterium]MBV9763876.1 L-seryl-tRNA(Sec) selenium transferase [Acidobacteriaceae bacterium]
MDALRSLPSVDQVLRNLKRLDGVPEALITNEIRNVLSARRQALLANEEISAIPVEQIVQERIDKLLKPSLRPVINATGVILHTNLGRAPLAAFQPISGYSNLEYDLDKGKRGKRDVHVAGFLDRLLGTPAIVVNNNAAAVYLVLNELSAGHEVIVSRGELIEIGDGFRIPEIMSRSGALLREIGTTNRTRIDDYRQAINENTRLILRVHPSNFRVTGFTGRPELSELAQLGRERGIPVYEDLGSGCLVDLRSYGIHEPLVSDSLFAGIDLVSFSCDKLLGGPQSGIIAGDAQLVTRIRRNPMYRAFRVDKLILESLETTLRQLLVQNWRAVPTLRMIFANVEEIRERAERVARNLRNLNAEIRPSESVIGGGSTPDQTLPTWIVELTVPDPVIFEQRLRNAAVPVIARIERDRIVLDMRTVAEGEEESLLSAVRSAAES